MRCGGRPGSLRRVNNGRVPTRTCAFYQDVLRLPPLRGPHAHDDARGVPRGVAWPAALRWCSDAVRHVVKDCEGVRQPGIGERERKLFSSRSRMAQRNALHPSP